jgi:hypothetical protein
MDEDTAGFPMSFALWEGVDRIGGTLCYDPCLIDENAAKQTRSEYLATLEALSTYLDQTVRALCEGMTQKPVGRRPSEILRKPVRLSKGDRG